MRELFITLGLPADRDLLALIGEVSIRHGQHDNALRMLLGTLGNHSVDEARELFKKDGSSRLRNKIEKMSHSLITDKDALVLLDNLLRRSKIATDKRNEFFHGVWGTMLDGPSLIRDQNDWGELPSTTELQQLSDEFLEIIEELNYARLESDGFLKIALNKTLL